MPHNLSADNFHTKKALFLQAKCDFFYGNQPFCVLRLLGTYRQRTMIILGSLESGRWTSY